MRILAASALAFFLSQSVSAQSDCPVPLEADTLRLHLQDVPDASDLIGSDYARRYLEGQAAELDSLRFRLDESTAELRRWMSEGEEEWARLRRLHAPAEKWDRLRRLHHGAPECVRACQESSQ